ncbi:hypothetical protein H8356DRAFT_1356286 [Neocallimastix lanati (nom. inval.)]|nr:hypothetical protein H8356DRAFT_1356286 [Neocallimastix sp. JGI-2020a]
MSIFGNSDPDSNDYFNPHREVRRHFFLETFNYISKVYDLVYENNKKWYKYDQVLVNSIELYNDIINRQIFNAFLKNNFSNSIINSIIATISSSHNHVICSKIIDNGHLTMISKNILKDYDECKVILYDVNRYKEYVFSLENNEIYNISFKFKTERVKLEDIHIIITTFTYSSGLTFKFRLTINEGERIISENIKKIYEIVWGYNPIKFMNFLANEEHKFIDQVDISKTITMYSREGCLR